MRVRVDVKVGRGLDVRLIETTPLTMSEVITLSPSAASGIQFQVGGERVYVLITPLGADEPRRSTEAENL